MQGAGRVLASLSFWRCRAMSRSRVSWRSRRLCTVPPISFNSQSDTQSLCRLCALPPYTVCCLHNSRVVLVLALGGLWGALLIAQVRVACWCLSLGRSPWDCDSAYRPYHAGCLRRVARLQRARLVRATPASCWACASCWGSRSLLQGKHWCGWRSRASHGLVVALNSTTGVCGRHIAARPCVLGVAALARGTVCDSRVGWRLPSEAPCEVGSRDLTLCTCRFVFRDVAEHLSKSCSWAGWPLGRKVPWCAAAHRASARQRGM